MDILPLETIGRPFVQAYGDGGFRISGTRHEGAVLLLPDRLHRLDLPLSTSLTRHDLASVMRVMGVTDQGAPGIELLLIGEGERAITLDEDARESLRQHAIALEIMKTGPACASFNFLQAEGRAVAAMLFPVGADQG